MVDFLTLVQSTFRKFQLKYEIVVFDIEITNRQRKFGVDLYDLIDAQRIKLLKEHDDDDDDIQELLAIVKVFQTIENEIKVPLKAVTKDIKELETKSVPALLIQRRKEEFGISIWPTIVETTLSVQETLEKELTAELAPAVSKNQNKSTNSTSRKFGDFMNTAMTGLVKGTTTTIKNAVGQLSSEEREVAQCVDEATRDIKFLEEQKQEKVTLIEILVSSGTTLECQGC